MYEGEVTELTPEEVETEGGGYGKVSRPSSCWSVGGLLP